VASAFWAVARRPRWIAALLLCLGIAAGFAGLGQWQLSRSFDNSGVQAPDTEVAVPLESIAQPQSAVTPAQFGRLVIVRGTYVQDDFTVITGRNNGGTETGAVLVGHLVTVEGVNLVVALGWARDAETALAAAPSLLQPVSLTGRYLPSEVPSDSDFEAGEVSAISPAELINVWERATPVYGGYLVDMTPTAGLTAIYSPVPDKEISLNLLNVFYAIEWVIFAGFAVYLWYRLVRDVVEREAESTAVE
jgi:cytochrome oxidase assembly protein ShyY1